MAEDPNDFTFETLNMEVTNECNDENIISKNMICLTDSSLKIISDNDEFIDIKPKLENLDEQTIKIENTNYGSSSDDDDPLSTLKIKAEPLDDYMENTDSISNEIIIIKSKKKKKESKKSKKKDRDEKYKRKDKKKKDKLYKKKSDRTHKKKDIDGTFKKKDKDGNSRKKMYAYKDGKRQLCRSDSESTDFEKYTYFDERRAKRKVKINPDLKEEELLQHIADVKIDNQCLEEEHKRINEIKLKERLKLRLEIKRLKHFIIDLKLGNYFKNHAMLDTGNTAGLIQVLKGQLDVIDYSQVPYDKNEPLFGKLETAPFTDLKFWTDLNTTESNTEGISPEPLWVGLLHNINPDTDTYFKPDAHVTDVLKIEYGNENIDDNAAEKNFKNVNYSFSDVKLECGVKREASSDNNSSDECLDYNEDWNKRATKLKNKQKLKSMAQKESVTEKSSVSNNIKSEREDAAVQLSDDQSNDMNYESDNNSDGSDSDMDDEPLIRINSQKNDDVIQDESQAAKNADEEAVDGICSECGWSSAWSAFIARHREAYLSDEKLNPCNTCNMKFLKSGHFDGRHRLKRPPTKQYRPQIFTCDICGQGCTSRSGLNQHRYKHEEAKFSCPLCSYKCRRKGYLKKHIAGHSRVKKVYQKSIVEKKKVVNDEDIKSLSCDMCDFTAKSLHSMKAHISTHSLSKSFRCEICSYITDKRNVFMQHMRTHTGEKPFQCTYCSFRATTQTYVNTHMRYHTGANLYKCNLCSYECTTSSRLKVHNRSHTKEKPIKCNICRYRCVRNFDLKLHMNRHKVNMLQCDVCDFICATDSRMKIHVKKYHSSIINCTHTVLQTVNDVKSENLQNVSTITYIHSNLNTNE